VSAPDASAEVSVVIPCLDEADTLATVIQKARRALDGAGIRGEIVVADNGSTDGSPEIARRHGARVVPVAERGYGNALMAGFAQAAGRYIVMGDADDSYDFGEIPRFVIRLREGNQLVQGCRLPAGGGTVLPGAMPPLHRLFGNPLFSFLARVWFRTPVHDINCGLRAFDRRFVLGLDQRCTGMEFATEMVIKASLQGARIAEVPITLHRDGRKAHRPHLRTFRDGWRTLRFFLMCTPRWLFLIPGAALIAAGILGYAVALPEARIAGVRFDVHTLLFASLFIISGFQAIAFAVLAKLFAMTEGLLPPDRRVMRLVGIINLETGLALGLAVMLIGCGLLGAAVNQWRLAGFGDLDYSRTMRWVIPGVTLTTLGFQGILASFYASLLGMARR
jgi:glycosyltransferase involved in cell wall biosynthesis